MAHNGIFMVNSCLWECIYILRKIYLISFFVHADTLFSQNIIWSLICVLDPQSPHEWIFFCVLSIWFHSSAPCWFGSVALQYTHKSDSTSPAPMPQSSFLTLSWPPSHLWFSRNVRNIDFDFCEEYYWQKTNRENASKYW